MPAGALEDESGMHDADFLTKKIPPAAARQRTSAGLWLWLRARQRTWPALWCVVMQAAASPSGEVAAGVQWCLGALTPAR